MKENVTTHVSPGGTASVRSQFASSIQMMDESPLMT